MQSIKGLKALITLSGLAITLTATSPAASAAPRVHDGFYMQLGLGLGYYHVGLEQPADSSISGVTIASQIMLGGTLFPGLVLGGGLFVDKAFSPTLKQGGTEVTPDGLSQYVLGIGPFVDYYLNPAGGLHFTGFVGWGGLETSQNGNVGGSDPTGLSMYVGGGYDWFISDEWSAGVLGRIAYGPYSLNSVSYTTIEPSVVGTLTWH